MRFFTALDGISAAVVIILLLLAADFAADVFFEFPQPARVFLLLFLAGFTGYVLWKTILRRCFARFKTEQLAALFENYVPRLNESLLTSVGHQQEEGIDRLLLQHTVNEAAEGLRDVNVNRFFRTGRIYLRFLFSILCVGLAAGLCTSSSATVSLWFSRNIMLSQAEYPRKSFLLADGFKDGRVRIGRGDSFTLSVRADMSMPLVPEEVRVRIGTPETGYRSVPIKDFRIENRDGKDWRIFTAVFAEMLETVSLQIRGADSTLRGLSIEVVPTPVLTDTKLQQKFPDYMQRPDRTIALTGRTTVPDGTAISIGGQSTKPLTDAEATVIQPPAEPKKNTLKPAEVPFERVSFSLPPLRTETVVDFRLTDTDLLQNRQPIRADFGVIKDQPPVVTARLDGIGSAVTPEASLPATGEITDDNGLFSAWFRYTVETAKDAAAADETGKEKTSGDAEKPAVPKSGTVPVSGITPPQTIFQLEQTLAISSLNVKPGDKLTLSVEANDRFNLDSADSAGVQGQVGIGPGWSLEIVTPEKLKTMLETREIALRQRFEVVIGEVARTKSILADFSLEPAETQNHEADAVTVTVPEKATEEEKQKLQQDAEAKKRKILDTILSEQSELGKYHISRMLRDTQKEVYDLLAIVESFRVIRQEMFNNKILTDDEKRRLDSAIMQPIHGLTNTEFPDVNSLLETLNKTLVSTEPVRPAALEQQQKILAAFDDLLKKMNAIRDNMASMESYNEAIELLRAIIKKQEELKIETIQEKNKKLRDLLQGN